MFIVRYGHKANTIDYDYWGCNVGFILVAIMVASYIIKMINKIKIEIMNKKKCLACGRKTLHPIEVRNALSRYCDKYICSNCGVREAFEGDFWHGRTLYAENLI